MASLSNYLRTYRKRLALTQEEVAFLLGMNGRKVGDKVCRDESFVREPSLQDALAYEAIYGMPVRELFAGMYEQAQQRVTERAKLMNFRKGGKAMRKETITNLIGRLTAHSNIHEPNFK